MGISDTVKTYNPKGGSTSGTDASFLIDEAL